MKVFITGVSSGIGRALAVQLVLAGHEVWGIAPEKEKLDTLGKELVSGSLRLSACDVQSIGEMHTILREMRDKSFIPDIVVLNAGVNLQNPARVFNFGLYQKTFNINLYGAVFWIQEFLQDFLERNSGHFIAICSTSAFRHGYGGISYSASKAALALTFRRLRIHFAKTDMKFSTIYFGPIGTELWRLWRGPKILNVFVPSADRAARYILRIFEREGGEYYFPRITTFFSRISLFVPESVFIFFSKHLTEKYGGD